MTTDPEKLLEELNREIAARVQPLIDAMKQAEVNLRAKGKTMAADLVAEQLHQYDLITSMDFDSMEPDEIAAVLESLAAQLGDD